MNEQLIVKNFGPIKDATVDFKRVTVFIGPTGGGKSTLAKLAAVFRDAEVYVGGESEIKMSLDKNGILNYFSDSTLFVWSSKTAFSEYKKHVWSFATHPSIKNETDELIAILSERVSHVEKSQSILKTESNLSSHANTLDENKRILDELKSVALAFLKKNVAQNRPTYIPSERIFIPSIEYSWAGLLRDDIGLPKTLLEFANSFSTSRKSIRELFISFLNVTYLHVNSRDFIKIPDREEPLMLLETASGIQSVTPLLVLLEHLSRNTEQAQSFIIEEPELNLYPTAQQGLLNWLVEKCTQGENDLTITTHSPCILSSCNLLLEAYKVAQLRPDLKDEIAAIVPKACWLNPDDFAAYYVADGIVKPITDERTHLIGGNELDAVSGDISDSFRKLLRLKKQAA
jgi:predicted ATPase